MSLSHPSLDITQTSQVLAIVGGYIVTVGLFSYVLKDKLFISEALLGLIAGIVFGPIAANLFSPLTWAGSEQSLGNLTYQVTRIVIGIQVLFCGISLPKAYLKREWKSLAVLLGPIMIAAWFSSALLIWALIPGLTFLESLTVSACITPTDPVLANSICKGRFAEKYVPLHVRQIIVAESGANDGLGFPFLYLGIYLIFHHTHNENSPDLGLGQVIGQWFYNIILYQIVLSIVLGALIGYVARVSLKFAERNAWIDHDNFLAYGIGLAFFSSGVVGILGSDDILCCFVVGNSFTWDDWFRVETEDHAFQDVIDTLINTAIFIYIGSIIPWSHFNNFYDITVWRLVVLGLTVMLLRRVPWVIAVGKSIPALPTLFEAAFAGFFGPIGVGAIFYVEVALQKLPEDRVRLINVLKPVVYFLVLTSVVVHGITIPLGKLFTTVRKTITIRSQTSHNDLVTRLPQAPTELPSPDPDSTPKDNGSPMALNSGVMRPASPPGTPRGVKFNTSNPSRTATPRVSEDIERPHSVEVAMSRWTE